MTTSEAWWASYVQVLPEPSGVGQQLLAETADWGRRERNACYSDENAEFRISTSAQTEP